MALQSPPRQVSGSAWRWYFIGLMLATYVGGYLVLDSATTLASGHPTAGLQNFFDVAWKAVVADHRVIPWHLVGAAHVRVGIFWAVLVVGVSIVLALAGAASVLLRGGVTYARLPLHLGRDRQPNRTSHWAKPSELAHLRVKGAQRDRPILGRDSVGLLAARRRESVLIMGPTRISGKSSSKIIPFLLEHEGPAIVTSVKRDLIDKTAGARQRMGRVYIYEPTQSSGLGTLHWSPLSGCENLQFAFKRWAHMAGVLGKDKTVKGSSHWEQAARQLMGAMAFVAANRGRSVLALRTWVNTFQLGEKSPVHQDLEALKAEGRISEFDYTLAREALDAIKGRHPEELQSIFSTCQNLTNPFLEPEVAEASSFTEIELDEFLSGPNTLYLVGPADDQKRMAPLFGGLIMALYRRQCERTQRDPGLLEAPMLMMLLDEAANVAPLEELDEMATSGLGMGVKLVSVFHDVNQLITVYGESKAYTVVGSHTCKVFGSGITDMKTLEMASKLAGSEGYAEQSRTGSNHSFREALRELLPAAVVRQIPRRMDVVIEASTAPFYVHHRRYYDDARLEYLSLLPYHPGIAHWGEAGWLDAVPRSRRLHVKDDE